VIPRKEVHLDASVCQLSQFTQYPDKPFGDNVLILKPEVKNISHKKDCLRIIGHSVEPLDKHPLNGTRLAHSLRAEMHI
jgi:hypothetical protein